MEQHASSSMTGAPGALPTVGTCGVIHVDGSRASNSRSGPPVGVGHLKLVSTAPVEVRGTSRCLGLGDGTVGVSTLQRRSSVRAAAVPHRRRARHLGVSAAPGCSHDSGVSLGGREPGRRSACPHVIPSHAMHEDWSDAQAHRWSRRGASAPVKACSAADFCASMPGQ